MAGTEVQWKEAMGVKVGTCPASVDKEADNGVSAVADFLILYFLFIPEYQWM